MKDLPDIIAWSIPAFILLVVIELVSFRLHADDDELGYEPKDTATSLSMGLGSVFTDAALKVPLALGYAVIAAITPLRHFFTDHLLFTMPTAVVVWPVLLIVQDLSYYWSHRCHHVIRVLWASHVVHHSSTRFNLSTALRQSWTGFTSFLFYVPMIALGVPPYILVMLSSISLLYQFWIHTERIDRMWGWFEAVFNTPSHHRVHHASQGSYLDRNFGGILIIWDKLFRSFEPEVERPIYGLTKNIGTYNPVRVAFHEWAAWGADLRRSRSLSEVFGYTFRAPGWQPAGSSGRDGGASVAAGPGTAGTPAISGAGAASMAASLPRPAEQTA